MRAIKHLTLAALLASAPLAGFAQESVDGEPDVTIRQEGDRTVEEYRVNGFLYAVNVTPNPGKPYFLVRAYGDINFVRADQPDMLITACEIFRWYALAIIEGRTPMSVFSPLVQHDLEAFV